MGNLGRKCPDRKQKTILYFKKVHKIRVSICLSLFLITCAQARDGKDLKQDMPLQADEGIVYYFGFEIQRITGIPEHQKIIFPDRTYFISRAGVVNTGKGYVSLDKKKFAGHLVSLKKCMTK